MPSMFMSKTRGGIAAALCCMPLIGTAEDDVVLDWQRETTWSSAQNPFAITLGAQVEGMAWYIERDVSYNRDQILRNWTRIIDDYSLDQNDPGKADRMVLAAADASAIYQQANRDFAGGIEVDDVELVFKGTAYQHLIFGLELEAASGSAELETWYVGVQDIPGFGTGQFGEFDPTSYIGSGAFHDDDFMAWLESPDMVGVAFYGEWLDGRMGYEAALGASGDDSGGDAAGFKDKNYDLHGHLFAVPYVGDHGAIKIMLAGNLQHPQTQGHRYLSGRWQPSMGVKKGPDLVSLDAYAEDIRIGTLSTDWVFGPYNLGASAAWAETRVDGSWGHMVDDLVQDINTMRIDERLAANFSTLVFYGTWALTGEDQHHGGGIAKPSSDFAWDGSGYGALEIGGRMVFANMLGDVRNTWEVPLSGGEPGRVANDMMANRLEGGKADEYAAVVNWYLNENVRFSFVASRVDWRHDEDVISDPVGLAKAPVFGYDDLQTIERNFRLGPQFWAENRYRIETYHFVATARF